MIRTLIAFSLFVGVIVGVWFLADSLFTAASATAPNDGFTQISGILSTAMMCFAILLAIRPRFLEPALNGLDKMYRLHKWLGVGALVTGVAHWLIKTGGGPGKGASGLVDVATQTVIETLRGPARGVAQPAMFIIFAFIAVALITKIPYRLFAKTHYLIAIPFLVLAFHSVVLLKAGYWAQPIGWLTLALVAIGTLGVFYSLLGFIGVGSKVQATVENSAYYPELRVLEANLKVDGAWRGHKPGQFAFITTNKKEGAHPFTIATAWNPAKPSIGFIAKELGDFTGNLRQQFEVGRSAKIEGPYGRFVFEDDKPCQIWVGAGVGIAPFVAHMRQLASTPSAKSLYLFHSTADVSDLALAKMKADAKAANVTLHILISPRDGRLTAEKIKKAVPQWKSASIWFCGPTAFGAALKSDFMRAGLAYRDFHQEVFKMR
ncbi:MAG: ferric reductase-like transmembrane domain-containing protein [Alphaproteobacteria bacterium]|nr:ferric reductase-like transmembrane domain-containing protein [Alphaproteobacteria bacterium]